MLGVPLNVKKQEEELKGIQSRKEEMKLPMLTGGMTVYVEKFQWLKKPPKTTQNKKKKKSKETNKQTKNLLELIARFQIQGQQRSGMLLYSGNKHVETKIKGKMTCKSQKEGRNDEGEGEGEKD